MGEAGGGLGAGREAYVRRGYEDVFDRWGRTALVFGPVAILSLVPLDYAVARERFPTFLLYRIATALALLVVLALFRQVRSFAGRVALAFVGAAAVSAMVALMIAGFGGHRSVYFAGFFMISIFVSSFLPLPPGPGLALAALVYGIYVVPILLYDTIADRSFFIAANVLLVGSIGAGLLFQNLNFRQLRRELALRHELDEHQARLEGQVADRTATLTHTLRDLELASEQIRALNDGLERRVRERTAELETANRELEAFSYSISHDLRTPLRAINGFAAILDADHAAGLDAEGKALLSRIRAGAVRMDRLVDALLAFARLGRRELRRERVEPGVIARQVVDEVRAAEGARAVEVEIGELPPAHADPELLRQVFLNLLANAFKFTRGRERPRVEVGVARDDRAVVYAVRDNGAGFDLSHAGRLFEVFHRLHGQKEFEGTGLGLAIVRRIVEKHGGRVWAEAAPGEGAAFFFTLGGASGVPGDPVAPGSRRG